MAQLRHDYSLFKGFNTEVVVVVPNGPYMIEKHVRTHNTPYPILSDKGSKVAGEYFQIMKFYLLGTPTVVLVEKGGKILYIKSMPSLIDEPDNQEVLKLLENREKLKQATV